MKNALKVIVFTVLAVAVVAGSVFGLYKYNISDFSVVDGSEKNTVIVNGYNGSSSSVEIPKKIRGKKVIAIGENAFEETSIKSVVIPECVTRIDAAAFKSCAELERVTINGKIESIADNAFYNCDKLTEITLPASVKTIGATVFGECDNLKAVNVENGGNFVFENGVLYSADKTTACFALMNTDLSKYEFPASVQNVSSFFFFGHEEITSVKLPEGLKIIDKSLFALCKNLKEVTIPEGVVRINNSAFLGCTSLDKLYIPESVKTFEKFCFPVVVNKEKEEDASEEIFNPNFTLEVKENSSAHKYAKNNEIKFEIVK